jgi:hypothetical protein
MSVAPCQETEVFVVQQYYMRLLEASMLSAGLASSCLLADHKYLTRFSAMLSPRLRAWSCARTRDCHADHPISAPPLLTLSLGPVPIPPHPSSQHLADQAMIRLAARRRPRFDGGDQAMGKAHVDAGGLGAVSRTMVLNCEKSRSDRSCSGKASASISVVITGNGPGFDTMLAGLSSVHVAGVEVLQARIGIEALADDACGLGRGGGPSPCDAVQTNRQLPPERMALCHTPAIRLLAPCWQVFSPSDPQNHCPGSISPRSISCWLSHPNFTELCHWKVLMSKVLPGFVFKALAVRKDAMTAVRLLCQGQA